MAEAKYDYTKLNTLAVVSLATGVTMFGAPAALVTGFTALAQMKQKEQPGRWMAITGIVLGFVGIAAGLIMSIAGLFLRGRNPGLFNDHQFPMDNDLPQWRMDGNN